ncbi:MAG: RNA polymerase sigma factor [Gammaproteobacteria bacterium]|nr:RNA polymerase sigma factor [Gammaproteobacteria bacterium]
MTESTKTPNDHILARRAHVGDQDAFAALVGRYERSLLALIRSRLGPVDAVADVLQETLVQAWTGMRGYEPREPRAWLYQVARNRCRDYLRGAERRESTVDEHMLTVMVDRRGSVEASRRQMIDEVVDTFATLPAKERQALESFYVEGFSIDEISARHRSPPGTIKRRLSHGRDRVREALGVSIDRRNSEMSKDKTVQTRTFPAERPEVAIERLEAKASGMDMRELTWWFVCPKLDDEVHWAEYQPLDGGLSWQLTQVSAMRAARRAVIHDRECVEIEVDERQFAVDGVPVPSAQDRHTRVWGRLTDAEVQWVGVERESPEGMRKLYTFLDDHFAEDFGARPRRIVAGDHLLAKPGGRLERVAGTAEQFADGVFNVRFGETNFRCTRVVEMPLSPAEWDVVIVAYVDDSGRTVLFRRYDDDRRKVPGESRPRREILAHAERLVIDGNTYVHSYDYLTSAACGADD